MHVLPLSAASNAEPLRNYTYLGCYGDGPNRAVPNQWTPANGQAWSVDGCRDWALAQNYTLYALQYGSQCYGSSNVAQAISYGPSKGCTFPCNGLPSLTCGGGYANDIYLGADGAPNRSAPRVLHDLSREPSSRAHAQHLRLQKQARRALHCHALMAHACTSVRAAKQGDASQTIPGSALYSTCSHQAITPVSLSDATLARSQQCLAQLAK